MPEALNRIDCFGLKVRSAGKLSVALEGQDFEFRVLGWFS